MRYLILSSENLRGWGRGTSGGSSRKARGHGVGDLTLGHDTRGKEASILSFFFIKSIGLRD